MQSPSGAGPASIGRGFLGGTGLAAMGARVGGTIPFAANMPGGLIPARSRRKPRQHDPGAGARRPRAATSAIPRQGRQASSCSAKSRWSPRRRKTCSTTTPRRSTKFFIRNNGQIPEEAKDPDAWKITIDGEVNNKIEIDARRAEIEVQGGDAAHGAGMRRQRPLASSRRRRAATSGPMAAPAAPNGPACRSPTCSRRPGVKPSAQYSPRITAPTCICRATPASRRISRGVRIEKAMDPNNLIVWAMNGKPLPNIHGGPVRLIVPGWAGSASQKWLTRIMASATRSMTARA